uniref:Cyclic nucleotide-binding domain-containing protein n=1 Tax=Macrostomum lignano TaxID=282301 RepID=A0A1I8FM21_9PLAT
GSPPRASRCCRWSRPRDQCRAELRARDEAALALRLTLQHLEQRLEAEIIQWWQQNQRPYEAVRSLSGRELLLYSDLARRPAEVADGGLQGSENGGEDSEASGDERGPVHACFAVGVGGGELLILR